MNGKEKEPAWATHLGESGRAFRLGREAAGSENLTRFIDAVVPALATAPPELMQTLGPILNEVLAAQQRHDYSHLADLLEYELQPLLIDRA